MSHTHCISTLLDLKDKTITFPEDWMKEVMINEVRSKLISGILSFQPTHCYQCGHIIDSSNIFIDSTHIKASANKKKYNKIEIDMQAKKYQDLLNKEINEDRLKHGKKPLAKPDLSVKKNKK